MAFPTKAFRIPDQLKPYPNGRIPENLMTKGESFGKLYTPAAWFAGQMVHAAAVAGLTLKPISEGYRPYDRQYALFIQRFSMTDTGRRPQVTRTWNQSKWYLRKGYAPCAAPGYSMGHGFGCAQDWGVSKPEVLEWLRVNAPKFGWYWESQPGSAEWEPWHLNWIG